MSGGTHAEAAAEAKAAFYLRLRARGIQNLEVLRAFERVPRRHFVLDRYGDLASRDLALPIGCGQTLDEPWLLARMIEALDVQPTHRVLQVGAGSGYATMVLAQLAAEVMALERFRSLADAAQTRLGALSIANAVVVWGDGLAVPAEVPPFDRILVHALLPELLSSLTARLAGGGIIVAARPTEEGQAITRISLSENIVTETAICPCRLQTIQAGLASTL